MIEFEDEELEVEGEQWQQKINHEDQKEMFTEAPEPVGVKAEPPAEEASDPGQTPPPSTNQAANQQLPGVDAFVAEKPLHEVWIPRILKFLENPTNRYASIGVGLGIVVGVAVAAFTWYGSNPSGRYDLGPVISDAAGLKGRLYVKWEDQLHYRLGIEPTYPERIPGFSLAAGNPPRPYSVAIQLRDVQGFELCSKEILLRYDAKRAEALAPVPHGFEEEKETDSDRLAAEAANRAEADAEEAAREKGKDIFELQAGPSGQIVSINAQGSLPCSQSAYENAVAWSFEPQFPSVAEQKDLLKNLKERQAYTEELARRAANPVKKTKKPAPNTVVFYIEGDDMIVDFDPYSGVISTRGRKTFLIDRASAEAASLRGGDLPMRVHYRCDQNENCALMTQGAGVLHTRLRR
ncbi:MAG: hypothetical protein ABSD67_11940 [Terracidiphilus sp.]|jgi:hypothetical protein